jgi:hypothetical protein
VASPKPDGAECRLPDRQTLTPRRNAAIAGKRQDEVRVQAERIFAEIAPTLDLSFEPYSNGSAFVRLPA